MNIQIFGSKKSNDSKKAERWFKERRIKYQMIDMKEKGMSRGELTSVMQAVGGLDALLDPNAKDKDTLALLNYLAEDAKLEKVLENPQLLRTPVVRNGKKATVGYTPEVWETWE
jgi:arsenate reductase-like glutaredoxin family protein